MARKGEDSPVDSGPFPAKKFWEELSPSWEDALDHLGPDHKGRFEAVELLTKGAPLTDRLKRGAIPRNWMRQLVSLLEPSDPDALEDRLWEIAGRHVRPVHRLLLGSDPKTTRKRLLGIVEAAQSLERRLEQIPQVTSQYLEEFYEALPAHERKMPRLDIDRLDRSIADLAMLCAMASNELHRVPHKPTLVLRRQTLSDVVAAIEESTARRVLTRWSRGDRKCFEFKGREGKVVRIFMRLVEPNASEASLVRLLQDIRVKKKDPRTPRSEQQPID